LSRFILSCTTCALRAPGRDELSETLEHAPAAGFRYWGVAGPVFWTPGVIPWVDAQRLNRVAAEAGMAGMTEIYAAPIPTDSPTAARGYVRNNLVHSCRLAERLHCPLVVFSGGQRTDGPEGLEASLAGLEELMTSIEGMDVKVALEPHYRSQYQGVEDFDFLLRRLDHPQLGITVDTGHFHAAGVDTRALIRDRAELIWNVHLKDHVGTQSVAIGAGEIDLKGIFQELHGIGYEGALALEIEPEDPDNLPRYVREARAYLAGLVREVTGVEPE